MGGLLTRIVVKSREKLFVSAFFFPLACAIASYVVWTCAFTSCTFVMAIELTLDTFFFCTFLIFCCLAYVWVQCLHTGVCHRNPRQPQHSLTAATGPKYFETPLDLKTYLHMNTKMWCAITCYCRTKNRQKRQVSWYEKWGPHGNLAWIHAPWPLHSWILFHLHVLCISLHVGEGTAGHWSVWHSDLSRGTGPLAKLSPGDPSPALCTVRSGRSG